MPGEDSILLRYPILVKNKQLRDKIYGELHRSGLGVSKMYPEALHLIEGVSPLVRYDKDLAHAEEFSRSILTLPTHQRVSGKDLEKIESIFSAALGED